MRVGLYKGFCEGLHKILVGLQVRGSGSLILADPFLSAKAGIEDA